jgi:ferredoxin
MLPPGSSLPSPSVIDRQGLQHLVDRLHDEGRDVIAPRLADGAIGLGRVERIEEMPIGWEDQQDAGLYRLEAAPAAGLFSHATPVHAWKRFLYPPVELLFRAHREDGAYVFEEADATPRPQAFLGIRACDLQALRVLDRVFTDRGAQPRYTQRRKATLIIAVNCTRSGASCFCASMNSGPAVKGGYDMLLTEIGAAGDGTILVEAGTKKGALLLEGLAHRPATEAEVENGRSAIQATAAEMQRSMVPDVAQLLRRNLEHRTWGRIAERCLGCANCTMVCPTCFCATVEDSTDLSGDVAERWRKVDSCFTSDFSYLHGGSIRRQTAARYRQWMTHKLSAWWDQFDTSGCVGCGRCITWCPVGIDITAEARTLHESEGGEPA